VLYDFLCVSTVEGYSQDKDSKGIVLGFRLRLIFCGFNDSCQTSAATKTNALPRDGPSERKTKL